MASSCSVRDGTKRSGQNGLVRALRSGLFEGPYQDCKSQSGHWSECFVPMLSAKPFAITLNGHPEGETTR
jgi:hypothetical protein